LGRGKEIKWGFGIVEETERERLRKTFSEEGRDFNLLKLKLK
jgi:hypothetical protein